MNHTNATLLWHLYGDNDDVGDDDDDNTDTDLQNGAASISMISSTIMVMIMMMTMIMMMMRMMMMQTKICRTVQHGWLQGGNWGREAAQLAGTWVTPQLTKICICICICVWCDDFTQLAKRSAFFFWRAPILSWPRILCSQVRMSKF